MSKRLILCLLMAVLSACSIFPLQPAAPEELLLLPLNEGPNDVLLKQKVTMDARGEQRQFLVVMKLEQKQLKLRALLPTGQPILSIDYDGQELIQDNLSSGPVPSEEILAVIQFALWPIDSLNQHYLKNDGWQLSTKVKQRILQTTAGNVLRVDYVSAEEILLENYLHDYRVTIQTLEKTLL